MGSVRVVKKSNKLFFDFRYRGHRCREYTLLNNSKSNVKNLEKVLKKIEKEIDNGVFEYADYFPGSKNLKYFLNDENVAALPVKVLSTLVASNGEQNTNVLNLSFNEFTDTWVSENEIGWRSSHHRTQMDIINGHLKPYFGNKEVNQITKAEILAFRSSLAKVPGRKNKTLSPKRINAIMAPLRQILNEVADRYEFNSPYRNIKPLKVPKTHVEPFTLEQVNSIINTVRKDFKNYYTVRFFTGMRTGEIDGLKWEYIDFDMRLILIRESVVNGEMTYTKTDGSQREIRMSQSVYDALKAQKEVTGECSEFVFCTKENKPMDHSNITKRVWYPILRHLGLKKRRPYQSRHTTATLWLASGENPEWIALQMGHSTSELLFRVYSRFVPNLTRTDGSAFERMLLTEPKNSEGGEA